MSDDTPTVEKPAAGAQPVPAKPSALPEAEITRLTDEIVTALKTVYDPEIPADIYEIGLIYRVDIADDRTVKVDTGSRRPSLCSRAMTPIPTPSLALSRAPTTMSLSPSALRCCLRASAPSFASTKQAKTQSSR